MCYQVRSCRYLPTDLFFNLKFILISAAECFTHQSQPELLSPEYVTALVGSPNDDVKQVSVDNIVLHPDYKHNYDADIAVVILRKPVHFNENIKPVCLPQASSDEVVASGDAFKW